MTERTSDPTRTTRCYDLAAKAYGEQFRAELDGKPFDRWILDRLAASVPAGGVVYDVGCGPGQVAAYLARHRHLVVRGLDASAGMVAVAQHEHPELTFEQGDMLALRWPDASVAGIAAFYAIVHFSLGDVSRALDELLRVLVPDGILVLAFHEGQDVIAIERFLDIEGAAATWNFFALDEVLELVKGKPARVEDAVIRRPYPGVEHPTNRAYVILRKQG
ncbi:MAG: class I SAM-dependent methyltransferase [Myxococcota bacterium]